MKPSIIGIGAQKCASSWVHSTLGAHPDIGVSVPKELDFFSYHFDRGYSWYEQHFSSMADHKIRFESSPSYFYDPRSPERVQKYDPDLRVIAVLRDPIARAFSNHLHEVVKGHIPAVSFEKGLANNPAYVDQGRYGTHLKRWIKALGKKNVLVLVAEDISAAPQAMATQLYNFAGADPNFQSQVADEDRNVSDRARSPALRKALRTGGDLMRRAGMEETLANVKSSALVAEVLKRNSVHMQHEIPPMTATTHGQLVETFQAELIELSDLIDRRDFPWPSWNAIAAAA